MKRAKKYLAACFFGWCELHLGTTVTCIVHSWHSKGGEASPKKLHVAFKALESLKWQVSELDLIETDVMNTAQFFEELKERSN